MKPMPFLILLAGATALAACSGQPSVQAADRTIYMAALEPKGSANVADEAFPSAALPAGGGYALLRPDADGKWTIETYRWEPSQIVVFQGDTVTLEIVGVEGGGGGVEEDFLSSEHPAARTAARAPRNARESRGVMREG